MDKRIIVMFILGMMTVTSILVTYGKAYELIETTEMQDVKKIEDETKLETETEIVADDIELITQDRIWDVPLEAELQIYIKVICRNSKIEPEYIIAMCEKESQYNAAAVGDNGKSFGLMQINPKWHSERMERLNCPDLLNAYDNVTVGLDILEELYAHYDGKMEMVLMAYNGGYKYAESQQWVSQYALDIMNRTRELKKSKNE